MTFVKEIETSVAGHNDSIDHGSSVVESEPTTHKNVALSLLDKFLWLWILLAMALGIILGYFVPNVKTILNQSKFVGVSIPTAVGLLVMMYPILCKIRYESLHRTLVLRSIWTQLMYSFVINWIFAPLLMVALAWAFLPDKQDLREGLILVGIARCIAMVLIWTGIAGGDNDYCAILVAFNSLLQIVLYPPFAILYINKFSPSGTVHDSEVSYSTVASSVGVYLGIPLGAAMLTRFTFLRAPGLGLKRYEQYFLPLISPLSLVGLLFTIIILFASQGRSVVHEIVSVLRVAAPLVVYFAITFFLTLYISRKMKFSYPIAVAQGFTASSNNFELAIAVAISTYGIDSNQALASTVGPLIEIPVLLALVYVFKWTRTHWEWRVEEEDIYGTGQRGKFPTTRDLETAFTNLQGVSLPEK